MIYYSSQLGKNYSAQGFHLLQTKSQLIGASTVPITYPLNKLAYKTYLSLLEILLASRLITRSRLSMAVQLIPGLRSSDGTAFTISMTLAAPQWTIVSRPREMQRRRRVRCLRDASQKPLRHRDVVYFSAGTYRFTDSIYLTDGVVMRGETPSVTDAKSSSYNPPSKLVFPKYEPRLSGEGTPNETAFKKIFITSPDTDSNIGIVNLDINRAGINLLGDLTEAIPLRKSLWNCGKSFWEIPFRKNLIWGRSDNTTGIIPQRNCHPGQLGLSYHEDSNSGGDISCVPSPLGQEHNRRYRRVRVW